MKNIDHKQSFYNGKATSNTGNLRIGSCLARVHRVMDARGKFGEHDKLPKCIINRYRVDIRTAKSMKQVFYNIVRNP